MQKELFAAAPAASLSDSFSQPKTSFLDRYRLSLRLDQTLVLMIGLLVAYVLVFSFGVETGKRYSMAELRAERAKRERVAEELSRKIFEMQPSAEGIVPSTPVAKSESSATALTAALSSKPVVLSGSSSAVSETLVVPTVKPAKETGAPESSKPTGRYTIQTVTVASKTTAERELKRLAGKGHRAFIIPGGKKLQICVDGFESRDEANRMMRRLKSQRVIPADAYVRLIG